MYAKFINRKSQRKQIINDLLELLQNNEQQIIDAFFVKEVDIIILIKN